MSSVLPVFIVCILCLVLGCYWTFFGRRSPLPPGPRRLPLIGNARDISGFKGRHIWEVYADWAAVYGEIIYLEVFGKPIVILSSVKAITELMEKRSGNTSDRPEMHMVNDLMKWDWDLAHMRYSDSWRLHRKTFHQYFQPRSLTSFYPIQLEATAGLLNRLLETPDNFTKHLRQHAGSIVLRLAYGYEVKTSNDYYVSLADAAIKGLVEALNSGSFMVDFLPILKYVPSWFPGAKFKRQAKGWAKSSLELRDSPFEKLKSSMAEGTAIPSFASQNLEKIKQFSKSRLDQSRMEEVIRNCAGIAYLAGSDSTVSVIQSFILAMLIYPSVQERAQKELDVVVGSSRLPDFNDRENLPYIDAILSEALRWLPVTPLALPHSTVNDDVYEGYFIPAGATIIGNAWAILHDPETYSDPFAFKPERFLKEEGKDLPLDPANFAFGFGRRICPGRYLALNSAWIAIASILACFSIAKAVDEEGREITPVVDCNEGAVTHPLPFKCRFIPRSLEAESFIRAGYDASVA